jgi:hypothetical protein
MCGCTLKVRGVEECDEKKKSGKCGGVVEHVITSFSGWCADHKP